MTRPSRCARCAHGNARGRVRNTENDTSTGIDTYIARAQSYERAADARQDGRMSRRSTRSMDANKCSLADSELPAFPCCPTSATQGVLSGLRTETTVYPQASCGVHPMALAHLASCPHTRSITMNAHSSADLHLTLLRVSCDTFGFDHFDVYRQR